MELQHAVNQLRANARSHLAYCDACRYDAAGVCIGTPRPGGHNRHGCAGPADPPERRRLALALVGWPPTAPLPDLGWGCPSFQAKDSHWPDGRWRREHCPHCGGKGIITWHEDGQDDWSGWHDDPCQCG